MVAAENLPTEDGRKGRLFEVGYQWLDADPEAALRHVEKMSLEHTQLLAALASQWVRRDPQAAAAWAAELTGDPERTRKVVGSLTAAWAESDPEEAARFADSLPAGAARETTFVSVISSLARADPAAALASVETLPAGTLQDQAAEQVFFQWIQGDPVAAQKWLLSSPGGHLWDVAASAAAGTLAERAPELAFALANNIADETLRMQRLENLAERGLRGNSELTLKLLLESDFPAARAARLFQ